MSLESSQSAVAHNKLHMCANDFLLFWQLMVGYHMGYSVY